MITLFSEDPLDYTPRFKLTKRLGKIKQTGLNNHSSSDTSIIASKLLPSLRKNNIVMGDNLILYNFVSMIV